MTHQAYNKAPGLNWSRLKTIAESPRAYHYWATHERPDTPAMLLGRAIHAAVLEPESYARDYLVRPEEIDGRTKEGKAWLATAKATGCEVLTPPQGAAVEAIIEHLIRHPAWSLLVDTQREVTARWETAGIACKGRLDAVARDRVVDLKTTTQFRGYDRDHARMLTHGQLAWYVDGAVAAGLCDPSPDAYVIVLQTVPPYDVRAVRLSESHLAAGRALCWRLLDTWTRYHADESREDGPEWWPGAHPQIETMDLPPWAPGVDEISEEW